MNRAEKRKQLAKSKKKAEFAKQLTPASSCNVYDFENDDEEIRVYKCKYCGEFVAGYTRRVKSKFKNPPLIR